MCPSHGNTHSLTLRSKRSFCLPAVVYLLSEQFGPKQMKTFSSLFCETICRCECILRMHSVVKNSTNENLITQQPLQMVLLKVCLLHPGLIFIFSAIVFSSCLCVCPCTSQVKWLSLCLSAKTQVTRRTPAGGRLMRCPASPKPGSSSGRRKRGHRTCRQLLTSKHAPAGS